VFNDYAQLEARYGAPLAVKIATRMAVLASARHLGLVPRRPPIRLRSSESDGQFTVDLSPPRRLRFSVLNGQLSSQNDVDEAAVEEIEVIGVD
jgi:hypothetical protein